MFCYRPQRSWAKVIFSQACVKNSVHRGGVSREPPGTRQTPPPQDQGEPPLGPGRPPQQGEPPGRENPLGRENPSGTKKNPPPGPGRPPPGREEDCSIRSMSGRYASYWNTFLLIVTFKEIIYLLNVSLFLPSALNFLSNF